MASKGHSVALSTFKSWGKEEVIGFKTVCTDGKTFVNFVHCKVCARNKDAISSHPSCKGEAKKAMLSFVVGTNFVTKHSIFRHFTGKAHIIALEAERSKPQDECILIEGSSGCSQPRVTTVLEKSSTDLYKKMFNTAYELAMRPTMPFRHFSTLIKCQRLNGVRLVEGKDDHRAAAEFIKYLADEVRIKIQGLLNSVNYYSVLSDGSQARKVKAEKELLLTRIIKDGLPTYLVTALLEMSE